MSLDLHLASRLRSFGRAVRERFSRHGNDEPTARTDRSARAPVAPSGTPSDGVPVTARVTPSAATLRVVPQEIITTQDLMASEPLEPAPDPLTADQLAYGEDAFHHDPSYDTSDDEQRADGATWNETLATDAIENGPGRRPLAFDEDGTIH